MSYRIGGTGQLKTGEMAILVYLDGLIDKSALNNNILYSLLYELESINDIWNSSITIAKIEMITLWTDIENAILQGKSILIIDGQTRSLIHLFYIHKAGLKERLKSRKSNRR